jgi:2-polyprenyl-3-methyl-5-hydroxy-6-metoxy-1,4-benzoquinol methylase
LAGYEWLHSQKEPVLLNNHKAFFDRFPIRKGCLLDVGCSNGNFLKFAEKEGFKVWGIDFDVKAIDVAHKRNLSNAYCMSFKDFSALACENGLKFDVITFFDVLEHQDCPREFIDMAAGLLSAGGSVAGSVPNRDRGLRWVIAKYLDDRPPHHFTHWSKKNIESFLNLSGFEDIYVEILPATVVDVKKFLETHVFKNPLMRLRAGFVRTVIRSENYKVSFQELSDSKESKNKRWMLEAARGVKDSFFLFWGWIIKFIFFPGGKGPILYFHARKKA